MYVHYAEKQRWKVELINVDEIGIGGMKEVQFTISGQGAYSKMKYEWRTSRTACAGDRERRRYPYLHHQCGGYAGSG